MKHTMNKFNEVYAKIIMEMNGEFPEGTVLGGDKKYNMTLLFTVVEDDIPYDDYTEEELDNEKYLIDMKKAGDEFFAKFGGKRTTDEDNDVAYYLQEPDNACIYAWPYEFNGLTKDQIFELMNLNPPYQEEYSLIELAEQYCEADLDDEPFENPDEMIEYLKKCKGASIVQKFEEL